jgi:hypothetical protein
LTFKDAGEFTSGTHLIAGSGNNILQISNRDYESPAFYGNVFFDAGSIHYEHVWIVGIQSVPMVTWSGYWQTISMAFNDSAHILI